MKFSQASIQFCFRPIEVSNLIKRSYSQETSTGQNLIFRIVIVCSFEMSQILKQKKLKLPINHVIVKDEGSVVFDHERRKQHALCVENWLR